MRRRMNAVGLVSVVVATALGATSLSLAMAVGGPKEQVGDYIIVLAEGTDASAVATEHTRWYGVTVGHVHGHALHGYSAHLSAMAATRIAADPRVASIYPDRVVTSAAQPLPTGIDRVDAEASPTGGIDRVDTRVVASGVTYVVAAGNNYGDARNIVPATYDEVANNPGTSTHRRPPSRRQ